MRARCPWIARGVAAAVSVCGWGCAAPRPSGLASRPLPPALWAESFDALNRQRWREVELRGRTQYEAVTLDGRHCLRAFSHDGASILVSAVRESPDGSLWLSWEWRVDQLVSGEALDRKDGSDAAARVYVYFESPGLPWQKRSVDYVWSASLPVGTMLSSPFSSSSKIIVVERGDAALGQWRTVKRNLGADYLRCFGRPAPRVVAIGIMSDTDNTHTRSLAYFDELRISRGPPEAPAPP